MYPRLIRFARRWRQAAVAAGILWIAGCAASDDPRAGGLFGYWQHGEKGYREGLERRREDLASTQEEGRAAEEETLRLQRQRDSRRAELERQRELLDELERELRELHDQCAVLDAATPEQAVQQERVIQDMNGVQRQLQDLEQDTEMLIQQREGQISDLKKQLKLLRERASLLMTL